MNKSLNDQPRPTIGIITALPKEYVAVKALLENQREHTISGQGAGRRYLVGEISAASGGKHVLVLSLADMGNNIAATRATLLLEHFPTVKSVIMVGIAGGIPCPEKPDEHIRLGDVVVSDRGGVIQYDFDTETDTVIIHRHPPRPPSATLLDGVRHLEVAEIEGSRPWQKLIEHASAQLRITRPAEETDVLISSSDPERKIPHPEDPQRLRGQPRIFTGPIASANKLLKNPLKRDELRNKFGVKAVEMESSGIADATWNHEVGYLVVRGICDYCDSNKGDDWQGYAAIVAAAYIRALLESIPGQIADAEKVGQASILSQSKPSDPFIYDVPVPANRFVGRTHEVSRILSQLDNPIRGSVALSGDPRIGRTSLLHYLFETKVREAWGLLTTWCHFLYLDCHGIVTFSEAAFWHRALRELQRHLVDDRALSNSVQRLLGQANFDPSDLNELFDDIARAGRLAVLILDEFERILKKLDPHEPGLLYRLRALINRPERGLVLLVSSREPLERLCADLHFEGSPFYNVFLPIILPPFSEEDVDKLFIQYQVDFSPTERAFLRRMAGTHPYLVQLAASHIVRARGKQGETEMLLSQIETELERETEGYFSEVFGYSSEAEQLLLTWLALYPLSQHLPADRAKLGSSIRVFGRYEQVLDQLVRRGFVLRQTNGPMLFSPIFAKWILRRVIVARGQDALSRWEPLYVNFLPLAQKQALEDLVDKVIRWPAVIKTPELLAELSTQDEASSPLNPAKQQVLGRYIIEEGIGGGGMADIFRAHDPRLDRPVAVKRLRPALSGEEEVRARFQREAQALAGLRHPHIVQVYDFGIEDNHYYMVMEFIDGYDLNEHLNNLQTAGQPLSWDESLRIATCVADALDYAHQRGMIHRDVKPSNILLTNDGGVFLTDFGLVRLLGQADLTQNGGVVGTPAYMAPEQIMEQSQDIDHRVDIYALGCVIYEMITGRPPFDKADLPLALLDKDPPSPSLIVSALPEAASQIILKALAKDPAERPPSASQYIEELRRALIT